MHVVTAKGRGLLKHVCMANNFKGGISETRIHMTGFVN